MPWAFRLERRQAESLPDYSRSLHEFALGQRDRSVGAFERRVDEHCSGFAVVARAAWAVARMFVRHDYQIVLRLAAIRHRPKQRVRVLRINVLVDGNDPFAGKTMQRRGAAERAPDLGFRRATGKLYADHGIEAGERLVHGHAVDRIDAEHGAQVMQIKRLHGDAPDHAGFAWRHLTDEGSQDRV